MIKASDVVASMQDFIAKKEIYCTAGPEGVGHISVLTNISNTSTPTGSATVKFEVDINGQETKEYSSLIQALERWSEFFPLHN